MTKSEYEILFRVVLVILIKKLDTGKDESNFKSPITRQKFEYIKAFPLPLRTK